MPSRFEGRFRRRGAGILTPIIHALSRVVQMSYVPINKGQTIVEPTERIAEFEAKRGHGVEAAYAENRRQWTEYPRQGFLADYPLHVDLELASICNLNCPMCYTITDEFKQRVNAGLMDFELFKKLVDECAAGGVYSLRLSLRGEAMLHKKFLECVRYAKERGIKEVSTLTNGMALDEKRFTALMEAGLDWITISVDGVGETYERIRKPAKFDRLLQRLQAFKEIKQQADRVKPVVKVQSIFPAIAEDPQKYYDIFAPLVDQVASNPLIDYLRLDDKTKILYHDDFSCPQLYQRLVVGSDGRVMLCSNDELGEHIVGDANNQTLHEIWHGEVLSKARESHARHAGCREIAPCSHCYLPRKTEAMEVTVGSATVILDNYLNRSQEIGR